MFSTKSLFLVVASVAAVYAAPSTPADCPMRMKKMDDSMKVAMIITNKDQKLNQKESEWNTDYCV